MNPKTFDELKQEWSRLRLGMERTIERHEASLQEWKAEISAKEAEMQSACKHKRTEYVTGTPYDSGIKKCRDCHKEF